MNALQNYLLVFIGGGVGAACRFLVKEVISHLHPDFPLATFAVNVFGSFLIGVFYALSLKSSRFDPAIWLLLTTGIMGGFTTFSSFSLEFMILIQEGKASTATIYAVLSVILSLLFVFVGFKIAH